MSANTSNGFASGNMPFPSLVAMRAAHRDLLQNRRDDSMNPAFLEEVVLFLQRGQSTGALLDEDEQRESGQSLLNFWSNVLYRANGQPFDATLADFDSELAPILPDTHNPYRGLDSFDEEHQNRFFGRQQLIDEAVERLGQQRLLALVGPSGSGKSSLARAGLLPALKSGALPDSNDWRYLGPVVPGSEPLLALARLFAPHDRSADEWSAAQLDRFNTDPTHLTRLIEEHGNGTALLMIDQFEEVFTLCDDNAARQACISNLLYLAQSPHHPHRVVLTMRSDFETFVARVPRLQALFAPGRIQVTPLNAAELRDTIERPAELVGLKFETGVVEALLGDMLGEPAALPLLQFTLLKLWEQRDHNRVTMEAYQRIGGGRLALARSADALYGNLLPEDQVTARRILLRLVRPGEGLEVTSSRVRRATLLRGGEDPGRIERVLNRLLAARLLRLTAGATADDDTVEVAHEALVRNWPTLLVWLDEERTAIATRRRLEGRAREWVRLGREHAGLFDEVEVIEAERWLRSAEAADLGFDPVLADLVAVSRLAIRQDREAQEIARQREIDQVQALAAAERARAEAQARSSYLLRLLVFALGVITLLAVIAAVVGARSAAVANEQSTIANRERAAAFEAANAQATQVAISNTAQAEANAARAQALENATIAAAAQQTAVAASGESARQTRLARAGQLAALSQLALADHPQRSLLLALEAIATTGDANEERSSAAETALLQGLKAVGGRGLRGDGSPIAAALVVTDGLRLVTASADGTVQLWDLRNEAPAPVARTIGKQGDTAPVIAVSATGWLAAGGANGVLLWDLRAADPAASTQIANGASAAITALTWSADGRRLIGGDETGGVFIWTLNSDGQPGAPQSLQRHPGRITALAACPNGRWLFSGNAGDGIARRWSLVNPEPSPFRYTTGSDNITALACSPDSSRFITGGNDGRVFLWLTTSAATASLRSGHQRSITAAAFSPNSQLAATGSDDTTARIWRVGSGGSEPTLIGHSGPISALAFSADGTQLVTGSRDGTARLWALQGNTPAASVILRGHEGAVTTVNITSSGQIVTGSDDGSVRVWVLANAQPAAVAAFSNVNVAAPASDQLTLADLARITDPIALACRTAGRNLSPEEWTDYIGSQSAYRPTCPFTP